MLETPGLKFYESFTSGNIKIVIPSAVLLQGNNDNVMETSLLEFRLSGVYAHLGGSTNTGSLDSKG